MELGQLAQQKAANPAVKAFGAMMVTDHTAANDKLKTVAAAKQVSLPDSPSLMQKASKTKLDMLSGDSCLYKSVFFQDNRGAFPWRATVGPRGHRRMRSGKSARSRKNLLVPALTELGVLPADQVLWSAENWRPVDLLSN